LFIALALSLDNKMGSDSVIECANERGIVQPYASLTYVNGSYGAARGVVVCATKKFKNSKFQLIQMFFPIWFRFQDQNIIVKLVTSSIVDGSIFCEVERLGTAKIDNIDFDMTKLLSSSGQWFRAERWFNRIS